MAEIKDWSTTAANNNSASPDGAPEGMAPAGVNNTIRENMASVRKFYEDPQWIELGHTAVYVGATQFKFTSVDYSTTYHVGRRVKLTATTPGTIYGTITAVAFSSDTTVTVAWDSGSLSNETIDNILIAGLTNTNDSIPLSKRLPTPTASKHGALVYQNDDDTGYNALTSQGTSGQALTSNGADAAPSWQTVAVAAGIQQIVENIDTTADVQTSTSSTWVDITGVTATITPTSVDSKIMILIRYGAGQDSASGCACAFKLLRDATTVMTNTRDFQSNGFTASMWVPVSFSYIDQPATTSAITYKVQFANPYTANNAQIRAANMVTRFIQLVEIL